MKKQQIIDSESSPLKVQIKRFNALLGNLRIREQKGIILESYGVESTKELNYGQLEEINDLLQGQLNIQNAEAEKTIRKKRSIILDLCNQYGTFRNSLDWERLNKFLMDKRIAGKLLYQMTEKELDDLAKKLRVMVRKRNEQVEEIAYKEVNN